MASWYGGTPADQTRLWNAFHNSIDSCDADGEWRRAYEAGEWFRRWAEHLELALSIWGAEDGYLESWIDERMKWAGMSGKGGVEMPDGEVGV